MSCHVPVLGGGAASESQPGASPLRKRGLEAATSVGRVQGERQQEGSEFLMGTLLPAGLRATGVHAAGSASA